LTETKRTS